ncbi:unnamed protein product [Soboliphyme baturini]|uniref:Cir_N domain-containing protein n=1 Tax=Soboliphyme baturini TaxID=241478 RepID=A0A183IFC6_9BILA|nr:unnamed protein product [Soboliphyme baturini]
MACELSCKYIVLLIHALGSSAGAGSGEYHIYRNIRKKENQRIQFIEQQALKEKLDREFQEKLEKRKREAEEKTARNRSKGFIVQLLDINHIDICSGVKEEPESDSESNSSENDEHKEQNTEDADFRESECKVEAEQQYEVLQDKDSAKEVADKKNHVTKE